VRRKIKIKVKIKSNETGVRERKKGDKEGEKKK
jgi:hypothetical protein